jgi:hypothetical protein
VTSYEHLSERQRELVDEAAVEVANLFGVSLEDAREMVAERMIVRNVKPDHGMGH